MNVRKDGCTLTGDQLAVSGAPTVAANINGPDVQCHSSKPHKTVDPSELAHLGTKTAALVTVQVGADDVDFGGCLMHEIKIYVPYTVYGQNSREVHVGERRDRCRVEPPQRHARRARRHPHAGSGASSPNATVVVLNYYQPVPSALGVRQHRPVRSVRRSSPSPDGCRPRTRTR